MANAWKKLNINKTTVASCRIIADKVSSKKEEDYWNKCAVYLESIQDLDHTHLSKGQKDYALKIKLDVKSEGF